MSSTWKAGIIFALISLFVLLSFLIGLFYYLNMGGFFGLLVASLLFWMILIIYLASIWFFPVRNRLSGNVFKSMKKCFLIMFDNVLITLFLGFIIIPVNIALWPVSGFIAFGPTQEFLFVQNLH